MDTSGVRYRGTGVTTFVATITEATTVTFVNNFRLISQGTRPDLIVMEIFHVTVDANGAITAALDRPTVTCR